MRLTAANRLDDYLARIEIGARGIETLTDEGADPYLSGAILRRMESFKIVTKEHGEQPFRLNRSQEPLWEDVLDCRRRKEAIRWDICKARQLGISMFIIVWFLADIIERANRFAYILSHESESAEDLFARSKFCYVSSPPEIRKTHPLLADTKHHLRFRYPHNSWLKAATANRRYVASSQMLQLLHLSEVAKYQDPPAKDAITSISNCVPPHWDTAIIREYTAQGRNLAYHFRREAEEGKNSFEAKFLTWVNFPEYYFFFDVPPLWTPDEVAYRQEAEDLGIHISDEQMLWARQQRTDKCWGDWSTFREEFPRWSAEAFRHSGHSWFDGVKVGQLKEVVRKPIAKGRLEWISDRDPLVQWVDDPDGIIEIYEWPEKDRKYVNGTDVAGGVGADWTVSWILKGAMAMGERHAGVARLRSNRIGAVDAATEITKLCVYYNWAFTGVEKNSMGDSTVEAMERGTNCEQMRGGYPHLFYHVIRDRRTKEETQRLGWITGPTTKRIMLNHFKYIVAEDMFDCPAIETVNEMDGFEWDVEKETWISTARNEQTGMAHDDEVMACAIALQMIEHVGNRANLSTGRDDTW